MLLGSECSKYENAVIERGYDVIGGFWGLGLESFEKGKYGRNAFLKMYFILVKISHLRALNTPKRQNGGILGGYDVIGGPRRLVREKF